MYLYLQLFICRKNTYLATYSYFIKASNGSNNGPESELPPVNPPNIRRAPGRSEKKKKGTKQIMSQKISTSCLRKNC